MLFALFSFSVYAVILKPVQGASSIPMQMSYTLAVDFASQSQLPAPTWTIVTVGRRLVARLLTNILFLVSWF